MKRKIYNEGDYVGLKAIITAKHEDDIMLDGGKLLTSYTVNLVDCNGMNKGWTGIDLNIPEQLIHHIDRAFANSIEEKQKKAAAREIKKLEAEIKRLKKMI